MREHFRLGFIVKEYILFESKYGRGRPNSIASEYFISLFIILIKHSRVSRGTCHRAESVSRRGSGHTKARVANAKSAKETRFPDVVFSHLYE